MKYFHSLKFKLLLILLCITLIPLVSLALFQLNQTNTVTTNGIKSEEMQIANFNADMLDSWLNSKASQINESIKAHPEIKTELAQSNVDAFRTVINYIAENDVDVDSTVAADKNGSAGSSININISDREYFKKAKDTKGIVISDIIVNKNTGKKQIPICVPVLDDNKDFLGAIISMINIETLKNSMEKIKVAQTGYGFLMSASGGLLYYPDPDKVDKNYTEIIKNQNADKVFKEDILVQKNGFATYTDDAGIEKIVSYSTVPSTGWKVVVVAPASEVFMDATQTKTITSIIILVAAILIILISLFIANYIATPMRLASGYLNVLANADFTRNVPEKVMKRKDELGELAKSVDIMSTSIKTVLHDVAAEAKRVEENISASSQSLDALTSQIMDVSATAEEMSAGMEETAASAQEMNAASTEIQHAVDTIATKAMNGSTIAEEISKRAQNLKNSAVLSQKTAHDIRQTIDTDIRKSIEQSKGVDKINVLTDSILQITSQTNLLALNAAIEAARAGEAGKGFAVVADEIRKLSESSQDAVTEIQNVTKLVVSSVKNLTENSEKALNFIDTKVIEDYNSMVSTGEQYYQDAEAIQTLVTDFSATAEELSASIQNIIRAINEVTVSNNEEAKSTEDISEKASIIMQKSENVTDLIKATDNISRKLVETVSRFKI